MENTRPEWDLPIETTKTGMQRNIPRRNYELAGKSYRLAMDNGDSYTLHLVDGETAYWGMVGQTVTAQHYLCMRANAFVWMVTFMDGAFSCVTVVLDTLNQLTTVLFASVCDYANKPRLVSHRFAFGAIEEPGKPLPAKRHHYTAALAGKKIAWVYSPVVTITHIYHTPFSMRSSLKDMQPLPATATEEQRNECENRAARWGRVLFDEPCSYVKINENLVLATFIEINRYRVDPDQGGGDLLVLIDTDRVHDVGRIFSLGAEGKPRLGLLTAHGRFVDTPDEMETAENPYWI
jgi:hypothetical protein